MNESKIKIAANYCKKLVKKHGFIEQEDFVKLDEASGKQLLNWDDTLAAHERRLEQAADWIARVMLERQGDKAHRAYLNAAKITEAGVIRAYWPEEVVLADEQMYSSARQIFFAQIQGLTARFNHLEEAKQVSAFAKEIETKEPVTK